MKKHIQILIFKSMLLFSFNSLARTVTIENQSPYIFSVYTNSCIADVLNIYNYKYEHISENGSDGNLLEIDLDLDQTISFHFRQINKTGEQIFADAEVVAQGGIKAYGFYNIFNSIKDKINRDSPLYPYVEKYFPFVSLAATAFLFGYELINKSLSLPGIIYEEIPASLHNYRIRIVEHEGRIFLQKLRMKEKQD